MSKLEIVELQGKLARRDQRIEQLERDVQELSDSLRILHGHLMADTRMVGCAADMRAAAALLARIRPESAPSKSYYPHPDGYIHPSTGRVAVLVRDFEASTLNGEVPAYALNQEAEEMGVECWRTIDVVNHTTEGGMSFSLGMVDGREMYVGPAYTIYLKAEHYKRLDAERAAKKGAA